MQIKTVEIERFAGIKSFKAALDPNIQLIAGPNNSCKSTILRAINLFFNYEKDGSDLLNDIQPQNDYFKNEIRTKTEIKIIFNNLTGEEMTEFKSSLNKKRELPLSIRINRQNEVTYHNIKKNLDQEKSKKLHLLLQSKFECIYIPAIRGGNKELTQIETQHFLNTTRNFLVSRKRLKNVIANEIAESIAKTHSKINTIFTESINNIQEILPESNDLSLNFPTFEQVITSILSMTKIATREGTSLTSENEGTGFQSLISLGLLELITERSQAKNKLLLVEEPEAFLHPQFQRSIANQMHRMSGKAQTVVTTHSSIMIDQFSISKILRILRNPEGLESNWKERSKTIDHLNHYCDTKNSELIFSEKTILVEGRSDKLVVESILKEIVDKNHHLNNISVIDCDGSGIEHISKLADSMGVKNLIILDKDMYAGQDKRMLIRICENKKIKLNEKEIQKINEIKTTSKSIKSIREVFELRDNANAIFQSRNIFTLSSDIEGSIISSFTKQKLLNCTKSHNASHLNQENIKELEPLSGYSFLKRAYELFGSKGAEITKKIDDNKPKPHTMNEIMGSIGTKNAIKDSDISKLSDALETFISE